MANPHWADTSVPRYLPEKFAQIYYAHGLFCSSHPTFVLTLTSIIILLCSYPLLNIPLPGNTPQILSTYDSYDNITLPRWNRDPAKLYVQQIIMKSTVEPWDDSLILTDAFRGPLAESFKLVELIQNYQHSNSSCSIDKVCLNIENVKKLNTMTSVLPEFNCLVLSPSNLWHQDFNKFQLDAHLINTIYNHQGIGNVRISVSEMLFGLPLPDAGIKRYPVRRRQRVIQFAVSVFMTEYHSSYIDGLHNYLKKLYPLSQFSNDNSSQNHIHIYYPEDISYGEIIPLFSTYVIVFMYIYFSVRKIEGVKSKIAIAICAVITILASLCMTIGVCFFFGLEFTGGKKRGKGIFPYLVIIVGLENVLVLVRSVVSTVPHLDVKIRVAQGLSREGWNFTKNLLVEVTILTAGLMTCVPIIQEFCILAIVGLLSDFFLQMLFFSTILSLNIDCTKESAFQHYAYYVLSIPHSKGLEDSRRLSRSSSHPRLTGQNVVAPVRNNKPQTADPVSKRVKVVHFWARTRFVQRSFMVGMILWISVIVYNADTIQNFFIKSTTISQGDEVISMEQKFNHTDSSSYWSIEPAVSMMELKKKSGQSEAVTVRPNMNQVFSNYTPKKHDWIKQVDYDTRQRLSALHWSSILSLYNISLSGSYITILPSITVVQTVPPNLALMLRNPDERTVKFRWNSLGAALDPIDVPFVRNTLHNVNGLEGGERLQPFFPTTPMEFGLVAVLCIISVIVLTYVFIGMYRCICSRNYAEWRSSWMKDESISARRTQVVMEALPIAIEGHTHLIECVSTDGNVVASSCLGGHIKIWDSISGEEIVHIDRQRKAPYNHVPPNYSFASGNTQSNSCYVPNKNVGMHHCNMRLVLDEQKSLRFDDAGRSSQRNSLVNDAMFCSQPTQRANIPIWSLDCCDNTVVVGCEDGGLEFWDCTTGELQCMCIEEDKTSITSVKLVGLNVLAAKLNGVLCFYKLDKLVSYSPSEHQGVLPKPRRGHVRTGSVDLPHWKNVGYGERKCLKTSNVQAHTKPITVMEVEGGRLITGSEDQTLKVFQLEEQFLQYTLHGHYGPVTCVFIDQFHPDMAGSGSQDGSLCVWDLQTGSCMYSIAAHDGSIFSLTYSPSYVISLGQDERLCVWDRFQGHLLNTIPLADSYCTSLCMLTQNLLVTSKQGCLIVLDVATGETIRLVKLGPRQNLCTIIRHIISVGDGIVCDYGDQLRLVRFPLVCDKTD